MTLSCMIRITMSPHTAHDLNNKKNHLGADRVTADLHAATIGAIIQS